MTAHHVTINSPDSSDDRHPEITVYAPLEDGHAFWGRRRPSSRRRRITRVALWSTAVVGVGLYVGVPDVLPIPYSPTLWTILSVVVIAGLAATAVLVGCGLGKLVYKAGGWKVGADQMIVTGPTGILDYIEAVGVQRLIHETRKELPDHLRAPIETAARLAVWNYAYWLWCRFCAENSHLGSLTQRGPSDVDQAERVRKLLAAAEEKSTVAAHVRGELHDLAALVGVADPAAWSSKYGPWTPERIQATEGLLARMRVTDMRSFRHRRGITTRTLRADGQWEEEPKLLPGQDEPTSEELRPR